MANQNKLTESELIEELTRKYLPGNNLNSSLQEILQNQGSNNVSIPSFSLNLYTPGSDLAAGFRQNQIIAARDGNDILIGLDPVANTPGQLQVDIFLADLEIPGLSPGVSRSWSNKFFLGDWKQPYYANNGNYDFGVALNFNPQKDVIQLHGTSADYKLVESAIGTAITFQQGNKSELVGFVPLVSNLSLNSKYFQFVGDTPPQGPVFNKAQQLGTSKFDIASGVSTDGDGNVYLTGGTTGTIDTFGGSNAGSRDPWVARYNSDGSQAGIIQFGSSQFDTAYDIATDQKGNSYITGVTRGSLSGGPKQSLETDVWVAKYDSQGKQEWVQQYGTEIINTSLAIDIDDNGNVYQAGFTVKSGGGIIGVQDDFWVTKYDSDGNRLWFSEFGDPNSFDECYGIAVDSQGNSYLTGWTLGNLAGENAGAYDAWVAKYDTDGKQEWIEQFGSSDYEFSWDIAVDSQGNSYATGWTLGDLGGENAGAYDAWVAKYDTDGNQEWIEQFGGSGADEAFAIDIDLDDNIFVAGYTDGNLGGPNAGEKDVWVAKFNTDGDQEWIQQFGTPSSDFSGSIAVDNAGSLFVVGNTDGSLGGINAGSWDGFIAKLETDSGALVNFTDPGQSATFA